jgi:hypothetical protein
VHRGIINARKSPLIVGGWVWLFVQTVFIACGGLGKTVKEVLTFPIYIMAAGAQDRCVRNLAIVGLKLLGILGVYWGINNLAQVLLFAFLAISGAAPHFGSAWAIWGFSIPASLTSAAFAIVLLARTDWVVSKLKFPEAPPSSGMEPSQVLRVGFILVGTFALLEALPGIGNAAYMVIMSNSGTSTAPSFDLGRIISPALKFIFIFGCIVIGRSDRFAKSVFRSAKPAATD